MFDSGVYAILDTDRLGLCDPAALHDARQMLIAYAVAAAEGGCVALQLRCKSLPLADPLRASLCAEVAAALAMLPHRPVALVVDDDLAAATAVGCGLHWGQHDGEVSAARRQLGRAALLGWSTHDLTQVASAQSLAVDYLGFGPVRATVSKRGADPVTGWAQLADAARLSRLPLVAIGGLEGADATLVRGSGAHAMAVIGAWLGPPGAPWSVERAHRAIADLAAAWLAAPHLGELP